VTVSDVCVVTISVREFTERFMSEVSNFFSRVDHQLSKKNFEAHLPNRYKRKQLQTMEEI